MANKLSKTASHASRTPRFWGRYSVIYTNELKSWLFGKAGAKSLNPPASLNRFLVELLLQYKRLWVIEESFRLQKHTLGLRPIYHFKPQRVEAHILICYLAFALMRHLEFRVGLQKEKISMNEMRAALWQVQSSYLIEDGTENRYRLPSATSVIARKLYQVMDIKRTQTARKM